MRHDRQVRRSRRGAGGIDVDRRAAWGSHALITGVGLGASCRGPRGLEDVGTTVKGKGSKTKKAPKSRAPLALAKDQSPFARIEDAVEAIGAGRMVIVVDDPDRENEGDLTIAAEKVTPEAINFMARYGRGQICLSMTGARLDELDIPLAVH